jgi:stage II sporulation protein D
MAVGVVAALVSLAGSCRSVPRTAPARPPQRPPESPSAPVAPAGSSGPTIRVGIVVKGSRASVGADHGLSVRESASRKPIARATFVAAGGGQPPRFRVQVASFTQEEPAHQAARRARDAVGLVPDVRWNEQTRTYQVRLGEARVRDDAEALATRLETAGVKGAWVLEEAPPGSGRVRLLETGEELPVASLAPSAALELMSVDGAAYRGRLEVRGAADGSLTVVNVLGVEDYLRGVVPNELSPVSFPELEALKAQAVAARTYALRNLGQFAEQGYDICATPACQVYRGRESEQALTDEAVEQTRGMAAVYQGGLVNALYTSTCGGHTEDVENIFEGDGQPYLRGVVCLPERAARATVRTAAALPPALGAEDRLPRDAALLAALGVLDTDSLAALDGFATREEARAWVTRLVRAVGRRSCPGGKEAELPRRGAFFRHLVGSLCWDERARRLLAPEDPDYLLRLEDRQDLRDEEERLAAALLIQEGILTPFPNNTLRPQAAVSRGDAVRVLAETATKAGSPSLIAATFRQASAGSIVVEREGERETLVLDAQARLFRSLNGSRLAARELEMVNGDTVRYVPRQGRVTFLEVDQSRLGPAADHASKLYRWEVRMTPEEVAKALARYGSVGEVRDLRPVRLGVSGRVVEMAIVGSERELRLAGLKVRWGLGLRENLFVVDRERDAHDGVATFIFTGKGWGHGVGLCQVGAVGMARAGSSYERILRHYYTGVELQKRY